MPGEELSNFAQIEMGITEIPRPHRRDLKGPLCVSGGLAHTIAVPGLSRHLCRRTRPVVLPGADLRFAASQHGLWLVPGGGGKPFSIASAPEAEAMELAPILHEASRTKSGLRALRAGY